MSEEDENYEEELVGNTTQQRNWRGILIALLVIVTVLGLIVTAIVLVTPKNVDEKKGEKIKFKDFMQGQYEPRPFFPVWQDDNRIVYRNTDGSVVQFDCTDNSTTLIMDNSTFRELDTGQYKVSPDGKYVLLSYDVHYQYRHSYIAKFTIYNTETKIHIDLKSDNFMDDSFQYVTWAPHGHSLVAVKYNNIYFLKDVEHPVFQQITYDGAMYEIYNGVTDWLYEEEILHSESALWFSPDGNCLVYASFDDRDVKRYDMSIYGPMKETYVLNVRLPYPKSGTPNPAVTLKVFHFDTNTTSELKAPETISIDHYLTTITWKDNNHVIVTWLNRIQNVSIVSICNTKTSLCVDNFRAEADGGWIDISAASIFTTARDNYFLILPQKDGDLGNFKHIAKIDANTIISNKYIDGGKLFVTSGRMEVTKIVGYDNDEQIVYFIAIRQDDPRERHLYSAVTSKDAPDFRTPICVTCDISKECLYVDANFSPSGKTYILTCKGPGVPYYQLMTTPRTFVKTLEDNAALRQMMVGKAMPKIEYIQIPIENDKSIWGKILLPPVLKNEETITYNLLFKVYGAPNTQHVTYEFEVGWEHYQSSVHGLIICYVDGRGTGGRGDDWLHANYKHLGTLEVEDTLAAVRHIKQRHYVNARTAIWGVSHGGFLTAATLAHIDNVFNCGVSVAPVTDWRYYDSFYTERYMGLPTENDNIDGYNQANVSRNASNFKKSRFLLIHGTGDDNVHFQNSAQLMRALTEKDVYFRTQVYTDQQHWLNGGNTRNHMYNTMEDFLFQCFGKTSPREEMDNDEVDKDAEEVEE